MRYRDFVVRFVSADGYEVLKEECGWWEDNEVLVDAELDELTAITTMVHEVVERFLELEMGYKHEVAHDIACKVEEYLLKLLGGDRR